MSQSSAKGHALVVSELMVFVLFVFSACSQISGFLRSRQQFICASDQSRGWIGRKSKNWACPRKIHGAKGWGGGEGRSPKFATNLAHFSLDNCTLPVPIVALLNEILFCLTGKNLLFHPGKQFQVEQASLDSRQVPEHRAHAQGQQHGEKED